MGTWLGGGLVSRQDIDIAYFRSLLEGRREEVLTRRDELRKASGTVDLDQARVGRLSRMDALQQQALAKAADSRWVSELQRIDSALVRIRTGEYGCCQLCGEDIAQKRLVADPGVATCITCAGLKEKT
ncbi:MAG: TraR/DksA family transcriptional regulator [bacterium]|nr:MAG: TraR/DksA family transcriptional regulator [bacterium]